MHDATTGVVATCQKEEIQKLIEDQIVLDGEGLEEDNKFLLELNLEDLESTSGENQEYWLLAILAAKEARILKKQEQTMHSQNTE